MIQIWESADEIGALPFDALVSALRAATPLAHSTATSAMGGLTLWFAAGSQSKVLAADGPSLTTVMIAGASAPPAEDAIVTVPRAFLDELEKHAGQLGAKDVRLATRRADDGDELLVDLGEAGILVQPLWDRAAVWEAVPLRLQASERASAVVPIRAVLERVADLSPQALTVAFAPERFILRTAAGLLGAPLPSTLDGTPTQLAIMSDRLVEALTLVHELDGAAEAVVRALAGDDGTFLVQVFANVDEPLVVYWVVAAPDLARGSESAPRPTPSSAPETARLVRETPPDDIDSILRELDAITGQPQLKEQVKQLVTQAQLNKERVARGLPPSRFGSHMIFSGPPGTGKTTVARLIAKLFRALGVLTNAEVVEVDRAGLVAAHIGGSEEKTTQAIERAIGGVLFIDEAYALGDDEFGCRAIDVLLKALEDRRGEFICIAAGYTDQMRHFVNANPGVKSRFASTVTFIPYTVDELVEIGAVMATASGNVLAAEALVTLSTRLKGAEQGGRFVDAQWGNARVVRNVIETAAAKRDVRISASGTYDVESLTTLLSEDVTASCDELKIGHGAAHDDAESVEAVLAELEQQVGQEQLKQQVKVLLADVRLAKQRRDLGLEAGRPDLSHLRFVGPPGTGKTTIARLLARLYQALGVLPQGQFVEVDRSKLVGQHLGETAVKTTEAIDSAIGGVLFIDEAYTLASGSEQDFGQEAIDTLLKRMSDDQGRFVTIAAGYPDEMRKLMNTNPGLDRRFGTTIAFEPYSAEELSQIVDIMAAKRHENLTDEARDVLRSRLTTAERAGAFTRKNWGNAGSMENLLADAVRTRNMRLGEAPTAEELTTLTAEDIRGGADRVLGSAGPSSDADSVEAILGELNAQIGQPALKRQVTTLMASVRAQQALMARGLSTSGTSLVEHLVFTGPPGTGKTTIARLLARLYKALGVLPQGHVVEVDRAALVAGYVGQTAIKTTEVIESAMGGVLFIDEAYTLVNGAGTGHDFGAEAIDTLLARMENDRGRFMVIAAGYPEEMRGFIATNPGLQSRFTQVIDFQTYTPDELTQIALSMARGQGETLTQDAQVTLRTALDAAQAHGAFERREWGNARTVRNIVDEGRRVRNARLFSDLAADPSTEDLTTITEPDIISAVEGLGARPGSVAAITTPDAGEVSPAPVPVGGAGERPVIIQLPGHMERASETPENSGRATAGIEAHRCVEDVLGEMADLPMASATRQWIRGLAEGAIAAPEGHRPLRRSWRIEGGTAEQRRRVGGFLARLYHALGLIPSEDLVVRPARDLLVGDDEEASIRAASARSQTGALLVEDVADLAQHPAGRAVAETLCDEGSRGAGTHLVLVSGGTEAVERALAALAPLRSCIRWSIRIVERADRRYGTLAAPMSDAVSAHARGRAGTPVPVQIGEIIGAVATRLAPAAKPGEGVPAGPELRELGIAEVYWQRSNTGAVGGMGFQMRTATGSKEAYYYFAGSSSGDLPRVFAFQGTAIAEPDIRDFTEQVSQRTLGAWTSDPASVDKLSQVILGIVGADRAAHG